MKFSQPSKDASQQRPPLPNPKYQKVQAVVESGMTVELVQYMRRNDVKAQKQPGENFNRASAKKIGDYISQKNRPERAEDGGFLHPMDEYTGGKGTDGDDKTEYLIVDVRDVEDYERCHIVGALHYPRLKVNHATNPFIPEIYAYKNKEKKFIVIYDLEEEIVAGTQGLANILFEKGLDNVVVLAGGLKEFLQEYSSLTVGEPPVPIIPRDVKLKKRADEATQTRSEARSCISHKPKSLSSSLAKKYYH